MIQLIIQLLAIDEFYGVSKNIDIAKGVNKLPKAKEILKQAKRRK
jgi:hypothetical protein